MERLEAAWAITVLLLGTAFFTSLVTGFHWELALLLLFIAAPLALARKRFYRVASLFDESFSWGWLRDIALVLTAALWIGFFAYQHVEYQDQLWWQFEFESDAPRMLRASLAVVLAVLGLGLYKLMRPAPAPRATATLEDRERAGAVMAACSGSIGNLALIGDKRLLFAERAPGFQMYQRAGRSLVAMADPVGGAEARRELLWRFRELCDQQDLRPVFYEVAADGVADYVDLGLQLTKLGEEAIVPLPGFSLEGRARAELRAVRRRAQREGVEFALLPPDAVPALLPELRRVSEQWLEARETAEKGFSVGYFDPQYLCLCPLAVARRGERVLAFANVWGSGDRGEASVDLMRYADDAPAGIMDFLMTEVMLWAKGEGYREFSLGMAPLAGLSRHRLAPPWHKLGDFIWRYGGAFYHFEGLRKYKEKYLPLWRARYLASPGGTNLPLALWDVARLIAGGTRAVFGK
jgi:phosphatidylglycerol lysyltransferase